MRYLTLLSLLAIPVALAHGPGLHGAWIFDDRPAVYENPSVLQGPMLPMLLQPRGLANASFRINYLLGGIDTFGYHLVNIGIHLVATIALWGVLERLFRRAERTDEQSRRDKNQLPTSVVQIPNTAFTLPWVAALIWGVHPITTQAVTYIVQRMESMWSAAFLVGLYFFLGTVDSSPKSHPERSRWFVMPDWQEWLAIACFWIGMMCKEPIVLALLILPCVDYVLSGGSVWKCLSRRRTFYPLLALPLLVAIPLVIIPRLQDSSATDSAGLSLVTMTPIEYWQSQPQALLLYASRVVWPFSLCFDYLWPPQTDPGILLVQWSLFGAACVSSFWAMVRRRLWGLFGMMFFITVSMTSLVPLVDTVVEHRAYLASAWLVVLVLMLARSLIARIAPTTRAHRRGNEGRNVDRFAFALSTVVVVGLSWLTFQRSLVYGSSKSIWSDTIAKSPGNYRAYINLADVHLNEKQPEAAVTLVRTALSVPILQRYPGHQQAKVYDALATAYSAAGDLESAVQAAEKAVQLTPGGSDHLLRLASVYAEHGRWSDSVSALQQAISNRPERADLYGALGKVHVAASDWQQAKEAYSKFSKLADGRQEANVAIKLAQLDWMLGDQESAGRILKSIRVDSERALAWGELANMLASAGRWNEYGVAVAQAGPSFQPSVQPDASRLAYQTLREAGDLVKAKDFVREQLAATSTSNRTFWVLEYAQLHSLLNDHEQAWEILEKLGDTEGDGMVNAARGDVLRRKGDIDGALREYVAAAEKNVNDPNLYNNLGSLVARQNPAAAEAYFRKALELQPENYQAWHNLGNAYLRLNRLQEAVACFERALEINPQFELSRRTLAAIRQANR